MAALTQFQSSDRVLQMMQSSWASSINPVLSKEIVQGTLLQNVALVTGNNVVNHLLGRKQVGWMIADQNAAASIYRSAALNDLTLTLNSSAPCVISLWVF
jgi:hypothetical protein